MSTTFADTTLQTDSFGVYHGEASLLAGGVESEDYEFSIPRADGVGEKSAGHRRRIHRVRIRWCTTNESQVRNAVTALQVNRTVGTLSIESATSGSISAMYCRLIDVAWGPRAAGYRPSNSAVVTIMEAVLTFKQVRI